MASGHSGISHPFGASHGTASAGGSAEGWGVSRGTEIEKNMREYVRWVPADAPLHERMYPNEFNKKDQPSQVVDAYMRQKLNAGLVSDPVGTHSGMRHRDTYPYQPDPSAPRMYYQLGVRPLEGSLKVVAGIKFLNREQHMEHMQFVGNNGDNFGMLKDGLFGDGAVGSDNISNMGNYEVLRERYNARLIDEARQQLEEEWIQSESKHLQRENRVLHPQEMRKRYQLFMNNCQDYIKQVLDRAATLERPNAPLKLN